MTNQLFEGQQTHPLSHEEKNKLYKKMRHYCTKKEAKGLSQQIDKMVDALNSTPTGCMALRQMLESDEVFRYDLQDKDKVLEKNDAHGGHEKHPVFFKDRIRINPEVVGTPEGAIIMAHESLHDVQTDTSSFFHIEAFQIHEAEAQAQTQQLSLELETTPTYLARDYTDVYYDNYDKWIEISKNPEKTPEGHLKFQPKEGVNVEEARIEYAMQMASLETQASFTRDFVRMQYVDHQKADPPLIFTDKITKQQSTSYANKDKKYEKISVTDEAVDDILSRNPFLNKEDFEPIKKAKEREAIEKKQGKALAQETEQKQNTDPNGERLADAGPHQQEPNLLATLSEHGQNITQEQNMPALQNQGRTA